MASEDTEVSILLTDDAEIAVLNEQYRGKPKPTDVLSFAFRDEVALEDAPELAAALAQGLLRPDTAPLGDVVISLETAQRQADEFGVSLSEEVLRLLIHGTLHLLGYDHEGVTKAEAERMRRKERALFKQLAGELEGE
ncbi:MAG: rRNA maturation RNase YbeY [Bdellovibrionales bacterium]|nr:rRNA maturation RNase YbeY [Bdellovibrionales bacterium]